jgi:dCMP deaminase
VSKRTLKTWDEYWKTRAYVNASMSTCIRRHVGAVAVRHRRSFADAFNGNIPGEKHCDDGGCARCKDSTRPSGEDLDECVCVHAESNLVSYCALEGVTLADAIVYCTDHPCVHCTKLLASSGVREVVYDRAYPAPDWARKLTRMTIRRFAEPTTKPDMPRILSNASLHSFGPTTGEGFPGSSVELAADQPIPVGRPWIETMGCPNCRRLGELCDDHSAAEDVTWD